MSILNVVGDVSPYAPQIAGLILALLVAGVALWHRHSLWRYAVAAAAFCGILYLSQYSLDQGVSNSIAYSLNHGNVFPPGMYGDAGMLIIFGLVLVGLAATVLVMCIQRKHLFGSLASLALVLMAALMLDDVASMYTFMLSPPSLTPGTGAVSPLDVISNNVYPYLTWSLTIVGAVLISCAAVARWQLFESRYIDTRGTVVHPRQSLDDAHVDSPRID